MKNEIIIYQSDKLTSSIEVRVEEETVWLNRIQISILFGRDVKTIGKHINNVFNEKELDKNSTVANFATVQIEGGRQVERQIEYYNLDRFLIIDNDLVYHIGASLKDLGKKWFAFSKFAIDPNLIINQLTE